MNITPLNKNIIFKFVDTVNSKGEFEKQATKSGILLRANSDDSAKEPRWANVVAVGPNCTVKAGQQVLIPALRWTNGTKVEGQMVWKTDETEIVAVRDNVESKIKAVGSWVIFSRKSPPPVNSVLGILIVGGQRDDTSKGIAITLGPDALQELFKSTIYYSSTNFFNNFEHGGFSLSFIKEEDILVYEPAEE